MRGGLLEMDVSSQIDEKLVVMRQTLLEKFFDPAELPNFKKKSSVVSDPYN